VLLKDGLVLFVESDGEGVNSYRWSLTLLFVAATASLLPALLGLKLGGRRHYS